jgi:hypothetical protein
MAHHPNPLVYHATHEMRDVGWAGPGPRGFSPSGTSYGAAHAVPFASRVEERYDFSYCFARCALL